MLWGEMLYIDIFWSQNTSWVSTYCLVLTFRLVLAFFAFLLFFFTFWLILTSWLFLCKNKIMSSKEKIWSLDPWSVGPFHFFLVCRVSVFATCPENLHNPDGFVTITAKSDEKLWEAYGFCEPNSARVFGSYQFYSHEDTVTKTLKVHFNTTDPDKCRFIVRLHLVYYQTSN